MRYSSSEYGNRSHRGFTIVELLIVVVVVAILAAITIVAYNAINERAYNARTLDGIRKAANALDTHAVANNAYPNGHADNTTFSGQFCLGNGYPDQHCSTVSFDPSCGLGSAPGYISESPIFSEEMKSVLKGPLPSLIHPPVSYSLQISPSCVVHGQTIGPYYTSATRVIVDTNGRFVDYYIESLEPTIDAYFIQYYIKGTQANCGVGKVPAPGVVVDEAPGWTVCFLTGGDVRTSAQ